MKIMLVDDDDFVLAALASALEKHETAGFRSAQVALEALESGAFVPDAIFLDVQMPGLGGYDLCRRIKGMEAFAKIPAVFISALNTLQDRINGYDAGGEDYIGKPFDRMELARKAAAIEQRLEKVKSAQAGARQSEELAQLLLENLDEYGALFSFMRRLNECSDAVEIVRAAKDLLGSFGLSGACWASCGGEELCLGRQGLNHPIELGIFGHMRKMDRIFEFGQRLVCNYENVSLLAHDMPRSRPEFCGRLRDHLAIAAEMAQQKLIALENEGKLRQASRGLAQSAMALKESMDLASKDGAARRQAGRESIGQMIDYLIVSLASLGLQSDHEKEIEDRIGEFAEQILEACAKQGGEEILESIAADLEALALLAQGGLREQAAKPKDYVPVELF